MKIIIYNPHTKEWNKFIDSLGYNCKGEERDKVVTAYIVKIGQEISPTEFVNNNHLYTGWSNKLRYEFIGEPNNPLEKIVKFVYDSTSYIHMKKEFPEDFIENRTDWDDMMDYADEMANFINELMKDMANTK